MQKEWRIALHALLQGYLLVGKAIPVPPHAYISEMPPAWIPASPPIFLDEQGETETVCADCLNRQKEHPRVRIGRGCLPHTYPTSSRYMSRFPIIMATTWRIWSPVSISRML